MSDAWNCCVLRLSRVKNQNLNRIRKTEGEIFSEHSVGGAESVHLLLLGNSVSLKK